MAFKLMACGPHRKNVTHNLSKVNHFYIEIPSYLKVTAETVVFSPNKSLRFLSLILQNNADVHRPYFKLGLCMVE